MTNQHIKVITVNTVVNNVSPIPETGRCRKTKLIVTYMYNSDDATMQTVKSHYITEGQYVACTLYYVYGRNRPYYSNKPHCNTTIGKEKWVRIIYVHIRVATCLNELKKGSETSKSKILRILKRGI